MSLKVDFIPYTLHFRFEAGTSRGTLTQKTSYIIRLYDDENWPLSGTGNVVRWLG